MKFEIPRDEVGSGRVHAIDRFMLEMSRNAQEVVDSHETCFGYLEVESYSNDNKITYPFVPVSYSHLLSFPFREGDFNVVTLPATDDEAVLENIALNTHKFVDVHVKLPSIHRGAAYREAGSREMEELRAHFINAGFYEIYSEAGNYVYTVQSLDIPLAKIVFRLLDDFAKEGGGIIGLKLEICKYFWRKPRPDAENRALAPVPPIVDVTPEVLDRLKDQLRQM